MTKVQYRIKIISTIYYKTDRLSYTYFFHYIYERNTSTRYIQNLVLKNVVL